MEARQTPVHSQGPQSIVFLIVRNLGLSATELVKKPGISQPSVSIPIKRVGKITIFEQLELVDERKLYFYDVPNIHYRRNYVI